MRRKKNKFEEAAERVERNGLPGELWQFLKENRKWWLMPILIVLLLLGFLALLGGTGAAPFIYSLF
jgi:hypothetical protein